MNYRRIYDQLIEHAQGSPRPKQGSERHHIVPRCLGGSDEDSNLVRLSFLEHIWAHIWLAEIYPDSFGLQLSVGWTLTGHPEAHDFEPTEELIQKSVRSKERARKMQSEASIGEKNPMFGRTHTRGARQRISEARRGKPRSEYTKQKVSENHGMRGTLPWLNPATLRSPKSLQVWYNADSYFELWKEHQCADAKLAKLFGEPASTTHRNLIKKFRDGWVPNQDSEWLTFKEQTDEV